MQYQWCIQHTKKKNNLNKLNRTQVDTCHQAAIHTPNPLSVPCRQINQVRNVILYKKQAAEDPDKALQGQVEAQTAGTGCCKNRTRPIPANIPPAISPKNHKNPLKSYSHAPQHKPPRKTHVKRKKPTPNQKKPTRT